MTRNEKEKSGFSVRDLVLCGVFAAVLCIVSPFTLPVGPIPLSLCNFVIMTSAVLLGGERAVVSAGLFVAIGFFGLPVFSGGMGGAGHVMSLTGGFILSYPVSAAVAGTFATMGRRFHSYVGFIVTLAGCFLSVILGYIIGAVWYAAAAGVPMTAQVFSVCVLPFCVPDTLKCVGAALLGSLLYRRLGGFLNGKRRKNP